MEEIEWGKKEEDEKGGKKTREERVKDGGEGRSVQGPLLVKQDQSLSG